MPPKAAGKRKSESVLPTGKSTKQRKTSAPEDEEPQDGDSSDGPFVSQEPHSKHVKKTRLSDPARKTRKDDEYQEDQGKQDTQQFFDTLKNRQKKKEADKKSDIEFMAEFKAEITASSEDLKNRLIKLSAESDDRITTFTENFKYALHHSRPLPKTSPSLSQADRERPNMASHFFISKALTDNALSIINRFYTVNTETENLPVADLLDNNWEEENTVAGKVLPIGRDVAEARHQALLHGKEEPVLDVDEEDVVLAKALVKPVQGADGEEKVVDFKYGWGKVVKKSERSVKKFVRFQRIGAV